ncbi:hypothetical protein [Paraburkholderia sp. HD33-4]|uniref:hypothetical protein n=1 Tax=Paraburkholderia sp. HD33-4 TaxID=2883242 RepID=UPI001F3A83B2|nr:hypothetical protein [Paraburkholderia sp. HD33-4]
MPALFDPDLWFVRRQIVHQRLEQVVEDRIEVSQDPVQLKEPVRPALLLRGRLTFRDGNPVLRPRADVATQRHTRLMLIGQKEDRLRTVEGHVPIKQIPQRRFEIEARHGAARQGVHGTHQIEASLSPRSTCRRTLTAKVLMKDLAVGPGTTIVRDLCSVTACQVANRRPAQP